MDFTHTTYIKLIVTLQSQGFSFRTFKDFCSESKKVIILRHDVDKYPNKSLVLAKMQKDLGLIGTYYFRAVPESWDERIINEIADMGHEIGYHYEDISTAAQREKIKVIGQNAFSQQEFEKHLTNVAIESFADNLEKLRKLVPVKTICMHGSPMSKWDNRLLWKYYDYHDFGIIGEPYFDINFDDVLYLTDTGRRWDGKLFSVRDKIQSLIPIEDSDLFRDWKVKPQIQKMAINNGLCFKIHTTFDIIKAALDAKLPDKIMMTFHPQRWTDNFESWIKELVWQNVKNFGKYFLIRIKTR